MNKAVKAARVARTAASQRLRAPRNNRHAGLLAGVFAGENHLWNILAMVVALLCSIMFCALFGAIYLREKDFFIETAKPITALIATIVAFIAGQRVGGAAK
jgi:hypothetical protein